MRTTQYIGLTDDAKKWVEKAINKKEIKIGTGMFEEDICGLQYDMPVPEGPNTRCIAKEVIQIMPWSSGPMIFTHLHILLVKECKQKISMGRAFSWVLDPSLTEKGLEYDSVSGHYYL